MGFCESYAGCRERVEPSLTFVSRAARRLPDFVQQECEAFPKCGRLEHRFLPRPMASASLRGVYVLNAQGWSDYKACRPVFGCLAA